MYADVYEFLKNHYNYLTVQDFKEYLLKTYEVEDNPKASKAFSIAWDYGHSSSYYEVLGFFDDIVDLIR